MENSPTTVPSNVLMEPGTTIVKDSVLLTTFAQAILIITEDLTQSVTIVNESTDEYVVDQSVR